MSEDDNYREDRDYWAHEALRMVRKSLNQEMKIGARDRLDASILQRLEVVEHNLRDIVLMRESKIKAIKR